jgi:hypothetical protein
MARTGKLRVSPKSRYVMAAATAAIILIGGWRWLAYQRGPGPVAVEFVTAIERRDAGAVHALALDQEREEMGLTQAGVQRALEEIFYRRAPSVRGVASRVGDDDLRASNWYIRPIAWVNAATGEPLPSRSANGEFRTSIQLFRTPDGRWRVSFTRFAAEWLMFNFTAAELKRVPGKDRLPWSRRRRETLFREWGIPGGYFDPAMIRVDGQFQALLDTPAYDPLARADWEATK